MDIKLVSKRETLRNVKKQHIWGCSQHYYYYLFMDYILYKYKNICILNDYRILYIGIYDMIGIANRVMTLDELIHNKVLQKMKNQILKSNKRFIVFLISFAFNKAGESMHANAVIYDKEKNELELFEPWGSTMHELLKTKYKSLMYYKYVFTIKQIFQHIANKELKFYEPVTTKVFEDFQNYEEEICKDSKLNLKVSTNGGFCSIWSMYYLETRMKNPDIPVNKLRNKLFMYFKSNKDKEEICKMIREYTLFVLKIDKNKNWIQKKLLYTKVYPVRIVKVIIIAILDDLYRLFFSKNKKLKK